MPPGTISERILGTPSVFRGWCSLMNEASQTRDYCVAKNATLRAARPDPSLRQERLLRMTIQTAPLPVSLKILSKIQGDTRGWLGTAYEDVPRGGLLQRLRHISNRAANQTSQGGMTDSSPARPSDWNIARLRQFKQARELR